MAFTARYLHRNRAQSGNTRPHRLPKRIKTDSGSGYGGKAGYHDFCTVSAHKDITREVQFPPNAKELESASDAWLSRVPSWQ